MIKNPISLSTKICSKSTLHASRKRPIAIVGLSIAVLISGCAANSSDPAQASNYQSVYNAINENEIRQDIKALASGVKLSVNAGNSSIFEIVDKQVVLKLSRSFEARLNTYLGRGYTIESITTQYIVVWYDEDTDKSFRVVLPEIILVNNE